MVLCNVCIAAVKAISRIIATWDATNPPPAEPELEIYKTDPSQRPHPRNAIQHLPRAELLPQSASKCTFCELIRAALVLADVRSRPKKHGVNFREQNFPVTVLLRDKGKNYFFADPLYRASHIYLEPKRGAGVFCGSAPKDGYHSESTHVILRPAVYNISNWHLKLDTRLVAFVDPSPPPDHIFTSVLYANRVLLVYLAVYPRGNPLKPHFHQKPSNYLKRWINGCVAEHSDCGKTLSGEHIGSTVPTLPTRVIDTGPPDRLEIPRLFQTNGRKGHYIALSHCWGKPEPGRRPLITTSASLPERLKGIPLDTLPKTFEDAITITKTIGLRYLWIDSLCIIQDDRKDLGKESATMGLIYERAHLTIAASHAYDSRFGCFYKRVFPTTLTQAIRLPFFVPAMTGTGAMISMKEAGSLSANIAWSTYSYLDMSGCTLENRGWITQEWALSRRMVHYLEEGMIWTCKSRAESESGHEVIGWNQTKGWSNIVSKHTGRAFTREGDRLISLEGLATEMKKTRMDQGYFFGLWTGDLPLCLLWKPVSWSLLQRNHEIPNVPSWSWASRKGHIYFDISGLEHDGVDRQVSDLCQIIDIRKEAKGCLLWIECRLKPLHKVMFQKVEDEDFDSATEEERGYVQRHGNETLLTISGEEIGWVLFDEWVCSDSPPHLRNSAFFLPVIRAAGEEHGKSWCEGLLLRYSSSVKGAFERVGVAQVREMSWLNDAAKRLVCIV